MDMNVSPDLDAWICYLIVLLLGMWTGGAQISKRLRNLPGKWIMLNTWALFFAYTAVPVALFWLLDRTGATHDTSLFASVLIGVGYQQILTGASGTIRAPGEVSAFWKPFAAWADAIAARISDRVAVHSQKFDERLLSRISANPETLKELTAVVMVHCADPDKMNQDLNSLTAKQSVIGTVGVQRKQAELLYQSLKVYSPQQFDYLLYKNKITDHWDYFWFAREGRSKVVALAVVCLLAALALASARELRNPEYRALYYTWRIVKPNSTDSDRFRARTHLRTYLDKAPGAYGGLIGGLRTPNLQVKTADDILALILEMKGTATESGVDIRGKLAEAMRTDNSDVRERIQKVLLYMADRDHLDVPEPVKAWHSDPKNSSSDVDLLIREWRSVRPAAAPGLASAVLKGGKPDPSPAQIPVH
jgi:hypothetical protein